MSLIRKIGFEKYPEVRDAFGSAWGTILVASSFHRIEIVYDTYLEVSIKDSTRIARAKEEPIEIITFPPVIKKNWTLSVSKQHLQIFSRNYFLIRGKEKGKNIILSC